MLTREHIDQVYSIAAKINHLGQTWEQAQFIRDRLVAGEYLELSGTVQIMMPSRPDGSKWIERVRIEEDLDMASPNREFFIQLLANICNVIEKRTDYYTKRIVQVLVPIIRPSVAKSQPTTIEKKLSKEELSSILDSILLELTSNEEVGT